METRFKDRGKGEIQLAHFVFSINQPILRLGNCSIKVLLTSRLFTPRSPVSQGMKWIHCLYLIIAIILCGVNFASAQQEKASIKGFVADSATGERLPLVNVVIVGKNMGAATDVNGFYFIGNISAGKSTIRVSIVGFRTVEKEITLKPKQVLTLNFELPPTEVVVEGITMTAERRMRYDTEISTQPIGAAEIELVPAVIETDLFRTISILPGIVTTSDASSQFYVRGGGGDQNLIILDGMTIYNPFHALGIFSIFDGDAVKEAEILKGGFPAEWGNRLSSVINIHSKEGNRNRFAGKVSASMLSAKTLLEGPTPWNGSWMISARKSYFDGVLQKFVRRQAPFDFYDIIGRVNHVTDENARFSFHTLFSNDDIRQDSPVEPDYSWQNRAFGFSWLQLLENKYLTEITISTSTFRGELDPKQNKEINPRLSEVSDLYFNGVVSYFQENGDLFGAGFMFRLPKFHYRFVNSASVDREETRRNSETGIWFKYKYKQLAPFAFEAGIRSDLFAFLTSRVSDAFEPRFSSSLTISRALALKFSYSRVHQRAITITNEDDVVSLFETWIPIPDDSPSQEADHFIIGIDGDLTFLPGLNFNVQSYYKIFRRLIDYNRDKVDRIDPDFAAGTGRSYGLELFLEHKHPVLYGWLSYSFGVTERTVGTLTYPPRYDRRHTVNVLAGWKLGAGWDLNARWEYGSGLPFSQITGFYDRLGFGGVFDGNGYGTEPGQPYTVLGKKNAGRLPSYHRLDISISKTFQLDPVKLVLEASAVNMYDRRNMFYFNRTTGERVDMLPFFPTATLRAEF